MTQSRWFLLICALTLVLSGCQKKEDAPPAAAAPAAAKPAPSAAPANADKNVLTLAPEALKLAKFQYSEVAEERVNEPLAVTGQVALNEDRSVRVGSLFTGRILDISVKVGDRVQKGQALARMHTHEVHEATAEFVKARAELEQRKQDAAYAKSMLERAERLTQARALARNELDKARLQAEAAEREITRAEAELERAVGHREHLGLPDTLNYDEPVVIRAPSSGIVMKREITPGASVNPGDNLFFLSDLSSLWVMAAVPEQHLAAMRPGIGITVNVAAYPDVQFPGRIARVGETLNAETRTVEVRCLVENRAGKLKPEMFATINIPLGATRNALLIEEAAVQEVDKDNVVFVALGDQKFEKRVIQIGRKLGERVEVLSGVRASERVVTAGSFQLKTEFSKSQLAEEE